MTDSRGKLTVATLLKIVLALGAVWLALQIVSLVVSWMTPILLLVVAIVVILLLLDRL